MEVLFDNIHDIVELKILKAKFDKLFDTKVNNYQDSDDISHLFKSHNNYLSSEEVRALESDTDVLEYSDPQARNQPFTSFYGPDNYSYGARRKEITLKPVGDVDKIASISNLKTKIEEQFTGTAAPNSCQANWYKDAKTCLNFHKDDEPCLDKLANVYIYSMRQTRNLILRKIGAKDDKNDHVIPLLHNSLLVLTPELQKKYLHSLSAGDVGDNNENGDRRSLVLRTMVPVVTQKTVQKVDEPVQVCDVDANVKVDSIICGDSMLRDLIEDRFNKRGKTTKIVKCSGKGLDVIGETVLNLNVNKSHVKSIVIHGGTNDITRFNLDSIEDKVGVLIDSLKGAYPNAEIFLSSILPRRFKFNSIKSERKLLLVNKILFRVCKSKHCIYVNTFNRFLDSAGYMNYHLFNRDNLHLNKGYGTKALARCFLDILYPFRNRGFN